MTGSLFLSPNWLMLIGGGVWLGGELWGVWRNAHGGHGDTTSEAVWWLERHVPVLYGFVGLFVLSLFAHFMVHTPLLP